MFQRKKHKTFYFQNNKLLIKFFEWLYFQKEVYDNDGNYQYYKIVKIQGINCFLVDRYYGLSKTSHGRFIVSPVWNKERFKYLFERMGK